MDKMRKKKTTTTINAGYMKSVKRTPELSLRGFRRRRPSCLGNLKVWLQISPAPGHYCCGTICIPAFITAATTARGEETSGHAAARRPQRTGRRRLIRAGPQTGQMFAQFDFLLDVEVRHLLAVSQAACKKEP